MSLVLLLGLLLAAACGDDSEAPLAILDITQGRAEIKTFGAADFVAGKRRRGPGRRRRGSSPRRITRSGGLLRGISGHP